MSRTARSQGDSSLEARMSTVQDLLDEHRPPNARAIMAAALLGADEPRLPVASLVAVGELFDVSPGAARTCLSRMVAQGELTSSDGIYALAGRLTDRRLQVDDAARRSASDGPWAGSWELAVVSVEKRPASDRLELRRAATQLRLAELREGVWGRPDNLPDDRHPDARRIVSEQCFSFVGAVGDLEASEVQKSFGLESWSATATRLIDAMVAESDAPTSNDDVAATLRYHFTLAVAVVTHLERDPRLPAVLLPSDFPADALHDRYRTFDRAFQHAMRAAARG